MKKTLIILLIFFCNASFGQGNNNCYSENGPGFIIERSPNFYIRTLGGVNTYQLTNINNVLYDSTLYSGFFESADFKRKATSTGLMVGFGPANFPIDFELGLMWSSVINNNIDKDKEHSYDFYYNDNKVNYRMAFNSRYSAFGGYVSLPVLLCSPDRNLQVNLRLLRFGYFSYKAKTPNEINYLSNDSAKVDLEVRDNLRNIMKMQNFNSPIWEPMIEVHTKSGFSVGFYYRITAGFLTKNRDVLFVKSNSYGIRDLEVGRIKDQTFGINLSFVFRGGNRN